MLPYRFLSAVFLASLFLLPTSQVFAHGGAHKPEKEKVVAAPAKDSMYSTQEGETDPLTDSGGSLDNMFSPTDLFTQEELVSPDPMPEMEMEGSHNEHAEHQETKVELSHHEMVSSSSKGYGTAIGITLFAGIIFAGLTFLRPGEK
jgi:hypothetical protein